jgi:hypothetical protein
MLRVRSFDAGIGHDGWCPLHSQNPWESSRKAAAGPPGSRRALIKSPPATPALNLT